ncbi:hypothetical protein ABPG74_016985 [Tetrahymena malaccensis]
MNNNEDESKLVRRESCQQNEFILQNNNFANFKDFQKYSLENLINIELKFNETSLGQKINLFTSAISRCKNLQSLNSQFRRNGINGKSFFDLMTGLQNCQSLVSINLDLEGNRIFKDIPLSFRNIAVKWENLNQMSLNFKQNKIQPYDLPNFQFIFQNLKNLSELEILLSQNQINERVTFHLFSSLLNCSNINSLVIDLSENPINVGNQNLQLGISHLAKLKNLFKLKMDFSQISWFTPKYIEKNRIINFANEISYLKSISEFTLNLDYLNFQRQSAVIAPALVNNYNLRRLEINIRECFSLYSKPIKTIFEFFELCRYLSQCKSLQQLTIQFNNAYTFLINEKNLSEEQKSQLLNLASVFRQFKGIRVLRIILKLTNERNNYQIQSNIFLQSKIKMSVKKMPRLVSFQISY